MENKSKKGGRPRKEPRTTQSISKAVAELLTVWAGYIGTNKRDLVECLIYYYLDEGNADFALCPDCRTPATFLPVLPLIPGGVRIRCEHCGVEFTINENDEIIK